MSRLLFGAAASVAVFAGVATGVIQDQCGPFTDVSPALCPYVLEMYYLGITAGTSPTTYSPDNPVTRGQAAVFVSKGVNQAIARSSRRAALGQWWTPTWMQEIWGSGLGLTALPGPPGPFGAMASDGTDIWVGGYGSVFRVRASDGKVLQTWTAARTPYSVLPAMGRIFLAGFQLPGSGPGALYVIDPAGTPGDAEAVVDLDQSLLGMAFDGSRIWAALPDGFAIITPQESAPWPVQTITGSLVQPFLLFDGRNMWATDDEACTLLRLDSGGSVLQTVTLQPPACSVGEPAFDGANILVPISDGFQVVRAADGALVQAIPVPGGAPTRILFDGERILAVTNGASQPNPSRLTLINAADFSMRAHEVFPNIGPGGVAGGTTDGLNFWLIRQGTQELTLARY